MRERAVHANVVVALGATLLGAAASLAADAVSKDALPQIVAELRRLPLTEDYAFGMVPEEGKNSLRLFKAELERVVMEAVDASDGGAHVSDDVRRRVIEVLRSRGVVIGSQPDESDGLGYGRILSVDASVPNGHSDVLGVTMTGAIPCGTDTSLYLFRRIGGVWKLALVEAAPPYDEISGALGSFQYRVSPSGRDGSFLVLTASIPPWCTSVWHPIHYRVYRVAAASSQAVRLAAGATDAVNVSYEVRIELEPDGFRLVYMGYNESDPGFSIEEHLRLRVEGPRVVTQRTRPGN